MLHHGAALRKVTKDDELVDAIERDHRQAPISAADREMLDYAVRLTKEPGDVEEGHVEALRDAGFDDRQILDIAQVAAYYNFVNRIALGLGVEVEGYWGE